MKVLVAAAFHNYTGPAITAFTEALWLKKMGVVVKLAISQKPRGNLSERASAAGLETLNVKLYRKRFNPLDALGDMKTLSNQLLDFDAVISHHSHDHWILTLARKKKKKPLIIREIHRSTELKRPFVSAIIKKTDGFIVMGESFKEALKKSFGVSSEKILVAPLSVDIEKFKVDLDGSAYRKKYGIPPDAPLVGLVSRIKKGRGHALCIEAAKIAAKRVKNLRWAFIGRGESQKEMEGLIARAGLNEKISIWGYVGDELPNAISACDTTLLLSEPSDGGCRAAIEAAACGKPTLALNVGAIFDVFEPEKEIFVLDKADPELLAKRVEELIEDGNNLNKVGTNARKKVELVYTEPERTNRIIDFLKGFNR